MQTYSIIRAERSGGHLNIACTPATTTWVEPVYHRPELDDINAFIRSCGEHTPIQDLLRKDETAAHARISEYLDALAALAYERSMEEASTALLPVLLPHEVAHAAFLRDPLSLTGAL